MHKYQPRVHVIRKDFSSELSPNKAVPSGEGVKTFSFPETVFTTVTAYQNQQVSYFISLEENCINQSPQMWDPVLSTISANVTNPCQIVLHNLFIFLFIPAESLIILPIATDFGMSVIKIMSFYKQLRMPKPINIEPQSQQDCLVTTLGRASSPKSSSQVVLVKLPFIKLPRMQPL